MPYCSGMGNLIFAFVMGSKGGPGEEVLTNSLVNNVTNLTLLLGVPAIIWRMSVLPAGKPKKKKADKREHEVNRLSLLLTLTAVSVRRSERRDRKSTRLNSSHGYISYAVFCL